MGAVYRARDLPTGARGRQGPGGRRRPTAERFEREAAILAELSTRASSATSRTAWPTTGARYLAMEWLDGEDLAAARPRPPTIGETLALGRRAAEALAVAHARGSCTATSSRATSSSRAARRAAEGARLRHRAARPAARAS